MFEEWAWSYDTLARFARHHETGEVIPRELVDKMRRADKFGLGTATVQQIFYAAISLGFHRADPATLDQLAEVQRLQKQYTPFEYVPGTKFHASFGHLVGYSAMYYTYQWSLVIAKDLLTPFETRGLMAKDVTFAYRDKVLAPGGSRDAAELVRNFLGPRIRLRAYERYLVESLVTARIQFATIVDLPRRSTTKKCGESLDRRPGEASTYSAEEILMKNFMIVCSCRDVVRRRRLQEEGRRGEAMSKMTEFKDKMCACKDSACAQKVSDEMTKWGQEQAKDNKEPPKMSEEETKKFTQIGEEMGKCMQKAMGGGGDMAGSAAAAAGSAAGGGRLGGGWRRLGGERLARRLRLARRRPRRARRLARPRSNSSRDSNR